MRSPGQVRLSPRWTPSTARLIWLHVDRVASRSPLSIHGDLSGRSQPLQGSQPLIAIPRHPFAEGPRGNSVTPAPNELSEDHAIVGVATGLRPKIRKRDRGLLWGRGLRGRSRLRGLRGPRSGRSARSHGVDHGVDVVQGKGRLLDQYGNEATFDLGAGIGVHTGSLAEPGQLLATNRHPSIVGVDQA